MNLSGLMTAEESHANIIENYKGEAMQVLFEDYYHTQKDKLELEIFRNEKAEGKHQGIEHPKQKDGKHVASGAAAAGVKKEGEEEGTTEDKIEGEPKTQDKKMVDEEDLFAEMSDGEMEEATKKAKMAAPTGSPFSVRHTDNKNKTNTMMLSFGPGRRQAVLPYGRSWHCAVGPALSLAAAQIGISTPRAPAPAAAFSDFCVWLWSSLFRECEQAPSGSPPTAPSMAQQVDEAFTADDDDLELDFEGDELPTFDCRIFFYKNT